MRDTREALHRVGWAYHVWGLVAQYHVRHPAGHYMARYDIYESEC
jgi:hypothetical protein